MSDIPRTFTVQEAAAQLRVSPDFVYGRVRNRQWPCTRMGSKISFTEAQIEKILRDSQQDSVARQPRRRTA